MQNNDDMPNQAQDQAQNLDALQQAEAGTARQAQPKETGFDPLAGLSGNDKDADSPQANEKRELDPMVLDQIRQQEGDVIMAMDKGMTDYDIQMANIKATTGVQEVNGSETSGLMGRTGSNDDEYGMPGDDIKIAASTVSTPAIRDAIVDRVDAELTPDDKSQTLEQGDVLSKEGAQLKDVSMNSSDLSELSPSPVGLGKEQEKGIQL